jgi:hypothetical protein
MQEDKTKRDFDIVDKIVSLLQELNLESQVHILKTVNMWLKISDYSTLYDKTLPTKSISFLPETSQKEVSKFSGKKVMSPKRFILEKEPNTSVARIACLAFYLTHYRDTPYFKTLELSKLNTEAAQQKFSNPTQTANDAVKCGLLVPASKGQKQISAVGEQYIQALPDQEAAKQVLQHMRKTRRKKTKKDKKIINKIPKVE